MSEIIGDRPLAYPVLWTSGMSQPRIVRKNQVLMAQVRVSARFFLLTPDGDLHQGFAYALAHYARKYGIVLHAICVMSNHLHLVFTDPHGNYPAFLRDAHRIIANLTKAVRGWRGPVFSARPNVVRLLTTEAVIDKMGYVMANPVAAGAVRYAKDWPGLCTRPGELEAPGRTLPRPTAYFAKGTSKMPDTAELRYELPACVRDAYGVQGGLDKVRDAVALHERRGRAEVARRGGRFLGPDRCRRVNPYKRAKAYEVFGGREPTFATLGGGREAHEAAVADTRAFRADYRRAWERFRDGVRDVVFPFGTWMMRVLHGVSCADPPDLALAA